jgi:hypothetical protein
MPPGASSDVVARMPMQDHRPTSGAAGRQRAMQRVRCMQEWGGRLRDVWVRERRSARARMGPQSDVGFQFAHLRNVLPAGRRG